MRWEHFICTYTRKYIQIVRMIIRRWWNCGWFSLHFIFYDSIRKVNHKPMCFAVVSKTFKFLPMAGRCLRTQRVAPVGLIREPPGWYPPVQTFPGSAPLQAQGRMAVWGPCWGRLGGSRRWWAVTSLIRTGKRSTITVKTQRLLDADDTMKITYHSCSLALYSVRGTVADLWSFFSNFFNVIFSQLNK